MLFDYEALILYWSEVLLLFLEVINHTAFFTYEVGVGSYITVVIDASVIGLNGDYLSVLNQLTQISVNRAKAVAEYLLSKGASEEQIKSVEGFGSKQPVADNATAAGRAENRRVEIFMYASAEMIESAENGTLE